MTYCYRTRSKVFRIVEEKFFVPGRFMLSILTDASRRDSANAGGGD